ncbi:hypothetical protein D7Y27_19860 [Corallococcus sp. AB004]|nr:hypothetical protein D7Y27_19860 [Corallococcus sp. AB004]
MVRSERLFCEQLDYNLLYEWFLDNVLEEALLAVVLTSVVRSPAGVAQTAEGSTLAMPCWLSLVGRPATH